MKNELVKIDPKEYGLEESRVAEVKNAFLPMISKMEELECEYKNIKTLPIDTITCEMAGDLRKKYVKIRTGCAEIHRQAKAFYLAGGKFVDAWKNAQLFMSQGIEKELEAIEKYFENEQKALIEKIRIERTEELKKYEIFEVSQGIAIKPDSEWRIYIEAIKSNYEKAQKDKADAELYRIEQEKKEKERIEAQRIENEKLKAEAAQVQAKIDAERKANEAKALEEKKRQDAILAKEKAEKERIQKELQARIDAENKEKLRIEKEKQDADKKAMLLLKENDNKRIEVWICSQFLGDISTSGMSQESLKIVSDIQNKFDMFKSWSLKQIEVIK